jgi:hypothetical protein
MFQSAKAAGIAAARKVVRKLYQLVCDGRTENDVRLNELEFAAALIAVERIGYERLCEDAKRGGMAKWLISGFTADEWKFVQREAAGDAAIVERSQARAH